MELIVATKNKKKLQEIKIILSGLNLKISSLADCAGKIRIVENGRTFRENAVKKAVKVAAATGKLSLGEDSGLCVDALKGAPGIYSSRFSGKNKSDTQNNIKLLKLLERVPQNKRKAHYVCAVALADKGGLLGVVEGKCFGRIDLVCKGTNGFGYDPLFLIPKHKKTFGQLSERIKHKMSHRYHALKKSRKLLEKYIVKQLAS
ncbi:MAG: RdgB/HAM1 family non-canonical purine NTP pyrophosphatase [Candidatus Omnitrophica bacterium]|nr:RdgB/HAM1 family non-canonical purine NTP pyrophosphatase [Candidatus Omnitrophota bacterium]MDD5665584.1 RdgB/HAM1 family non-canonical purine NTP pyrophosphatase [Candidatus Omnitrophota bacterium]